MRGQHRAHQRAGEPVEHRGAIDARSRETLQGVAQIALARRRAGQRMRPPPAILVHVLGNVGEMRKITERANDIEHALDRQRVQHRSQRMARGIGLGAARAAEGDGRLADRLDSRVAFGAGLRAQHVAEHASQQPRVFLERQVLVVVGRRVHRHRRRNHQRVGSVGVRAVRIASASDTTAAAYRRLLL